MTIRISIETMKSMNTRKTQYSWKTFKNIIDKHGWNWEFIGNGPAVHVWKDFDTNESAIDSRKKIEPDLIKMDRSKFYSFTIRRA